MHDDIYKKDYIMATESNKIVSMTTIIAHIIAQHAGSFG